MDQRFCKITLKYENKNEFVTFISKIQKKYSYALCISWRVGIQAQKEFLNNCKWKFCK